jgi:urease accessory protein UreF
MIERLRDEVERLASVVRELGGNVQYPSVYDSPAVKAAYRKWEAAYDRLQAAKDVAREEREQKRQKDLATLRLFVGLSDEEVIEELEAAEPGDYPIEVVTLKSLSWVVGLQTAIKAAYCAPVKVAIHEGRLWADAAGYEGDGAVRVHSKTEGVGGGWGHAPENITRKGLI